jgi:hypothetical protein
MKKKTLTELAEARKQAWDAMQATKSGSPERRYAVAVWQRAKAEHQAAK